MVLLFFSLCFGSPPFPHLSFHLLLPVCPFCKYPPPPPPCSESSHFAFNSPLCLFLPFSHSSDTSVFPYRKGAPPPLPPRMSKSSLSVRAQSSTESTQDAYFQSSGQLASVSGRPKQHSNSVDMGSSDGPSGRTSRGGYYTATGPGRSRQHSNSAESLDGVRGSRELVPYGGGPGVGVRAKHSSSADSLLEGPPRPARERDGKAVGSLGKSVSLPQNSLVLSKAAGQDEGRRKWSPSIAVQVSKDPKRLVSSVQQPQSSEIQVAV